MSVDPGAVAALLNGPGVTGMLTDAAEKYAAEVQRLVPVQSGHSRLYVDSISVGRAEHGSDGAVVAVQTDDPFWHLIEYGSINNEPLAPMRRAAANLGLKLEETPKP